jgi:uncharacterized phage protein (TIGR02218 family)
MSYSAIEASVADGRPYYLYLFDNGIAPVRLTSEPQKLVRMGESWTASPVSHGEIEVTGNAEKQAVELIFPLSDTYARTLLVPATATTSVTIWRGHHGDMTATHRVAWKGRVLVARSTQQTIVVSVESIFTSLRRPGCTARYQRSCRHSLYDDGCTLDYEAHKVPATVSAIAGLTLTVAEADAEPDGEYTAGIVEWQGALGWVEKHEGASLRLVTEIPGLAAAVAQAAQAVFIAPGCNLSIERCKEFDNQPNHGGFPHLPNKNPFSVGIA